MFNRKQHKNKKKEFFFKFSTCSRGHQMKAKMNSCILNQLQLVSYSHLNNVVVNCLPISSLNGLNFPVPEALLKKTLIKFSLINSNEISYSQQISNYTFFFLKHILLLGF